jgi:hypothetical protein
MGERMLRHDVESSPQTYARVGGALYLMLIGLGGVGLFARDSLIVASDAAVTAVNITTHESLWRLGIAAELVALICAIVLAMIYFVLLRPVSRELNLVATFLRLVATAIQAVAILNLAAALFPLGNAAYLKAFTPDQLYAMTRLAIRSHAYGYGLSLLFFGSCFLAHGRLIFRSGFLPKSLGILIQVAGVCYLTNSFTLFLAPNIYEQIFPAILLPAFVAEVSLCFWLLMKGVNVERWRQASADMRRLRQAGA